MDINGSQSRISSISLKLRTEQKMPEIISPKENSDSILIVETAVYATRFWIIGLFSIVAFMQTTIWGTFGPIRDSVQYAYGWSDSYIALLGSWDPVVCVLLMVPLSWFNSKYGLRNGVLMALALLVVGTGLRCISTNDIAFTYLASAGAIVTGVANGITLPLPAQISSKWFPHTERATATAMAALCFRLGGIGMYLSPILVRSPPQNFSIDVSSNETMPSIDDVRGDIQILMFVHFGVVSLCLIGALIYFPATPPKPPSISSSVERIEYFLSLKSLLRNFTAISLMVPFIAGLAFSFSWLSVLNFSLRCLGITQKETMWIGIATCIFSSIVAVSAARLGDRLVGRHKSIIMSLMLASATFFFWFLLISEEIIISSSVQVYVSVVGALSFGYAATPLVVELAVELAYPCPEPVIGGFQTFVLDLMASMFMLFLMIPTECYQWVNILLVVTQLLALIPIALVKEKYNRSELDRINI